MTYRIAVREIRETAYWKNYDEHFGTRRSVYSFNKTLNEDLKKYNARLLTVANANISVVYVEFDSPEDWFEFKVIWS